MKTKRVLSFILAFAMILTTIASMGIVSISATETETTAKDDFMMYDFSSDSTSASTWNYNNKSLGASGKLESTTDVTRHDSDYSMKWSTGEKTARAQAIGYYDTSKLTYEQATSYKYLNMWMYSDYGENASVPEKPESLYVLIESESKIIYTKNGDGYVSARKDSNTGADVACPIYHQGGINLDWQGWKLVSIDISGMSCSWKGGYIDNSSGTLCTASDFQKVKVRFGNDGYGKDSETNTWKPIDDNIVYVDSVWLSDTDPRAIGQSDITLNVDNGATDIAVGTKNFVITANKEFALGKDNLEDALTITADGETVDKSAYTLQKEFNKLYVDFKNDLDQNTRYTFTLDSTKCAFSDGTTPTADFSSSFTTEQLIYMLGDFGNDGLKGWSAVNKGHTATLTDQITRGKRYSVAWKASANTDGMHFQKSTAADVKVSEIGDWDYANIWMYSEKSSAEQFNVLLQSPSHKIVRSSDGNEEWRNYYLQAAVTADWTGWKLIKIQLPKTGVKSGFSITNDTIYEQNSECIWEKSDKTMYDLTKDENLNVFLNRGSWGKKDTVDADNTLYIDSFYLSRDSKGTSDAQTKADYVIYDDTTGSTLQYTYGTKSYLAEDNTEHTNWSDKSLNFVANQTVTQSGTEYANVERAHTADLSKLSTNKLTMKEALNYKYINMWIYSKYDEDTVPAAPEKMSILFTGAELTKYSLKNGTYTAGSNAIYAQKTLSIDWSGWKLVSIDTSGMNLSWKGFYQKVGEGDDATYKPITLDDGVPDSLTFQFRNDGDSVQNSAVANNVIRFDSIWLSDEKPSESEMSSVCNVAYGGTVSADTRSIGFTYPGVNLSNGKDYGVTVKKGDTTLTAGTDYTVQNAGDTVNVVFNYGLTPEASYTVGVGKLETRKGTYGKTEVAFTAGAPMTAVDYDKVISGENVIGYANVANATDTDAVGIVMITAIYDADDNLVSASIGDATDVAKGHVVQLRAAASGYADGYKIKCFVWNGTSLAPIADSAEWK